MEFGKNFEILREILTNVCFMRILYFVQNLKESINCFHFYNHLNNRCRKDKPKTSFFFI